MKIDDVKIGDLLYAVGPGHHAPHSPTDLRLYAASVKNVRLDGSYSASATPADLASAVIGVDLGDDRPVLGFPQWTYKDYEVGVKVHRSAAEALQAFANYARVRRDEAERARDRADSEIKWAADQALALTAVSP